MIAYLEGTLLGRDEERVVVLAGGVGYELLLPATERAAVAGKRVGPPGEGDTVRLHVSYNLSGQSPKPLLVGFGSELARGFFEKLITVEGVGPALAVRAMTVPVPAMARAIEERDTDFLKALKGVGQRTAEKIVASLRGKVAKWALMPEAEAGPAEAVPEAARAEVMQVLVRQMGYGRAEALRVVQEALRRNPLVQTAEEIFDEAFRARRASEG